ncbi:uncharacterized protein B0H18DRAFT_1101423 [Fomitopsis serialis]|uniref:uncharacterized protein n=1 Tax=Fomitopsis serialis TaxID=139415 RepID=UPI0020072D04|nr:uncharacterized protein B0H18DRAFT_1101423 [Neoantrodia serialis]KAH9935792.1 hypothetical protein B0H18DRAFT_1101423 [Neoantrodia serialis]
MKRAADTELALPSSPAESSASPAPSSSEPPRKRSRSETSPEERKEARAHRNRIAAQNSRDRRKAQFTLLERRVAELQEENRQLRAGMGLMGLKQSEDDKVKEQRERDRARDRENEGLRARIKTLESGWEAVVKALSASGLPLNIPGAPVPSSSTSPSNPPPADSPSSDAPTTTTFPVLVPPSPTSVYPISPAPTDPSTPLELFNDFAPTCHLARVLPSDTNLLQLTLGLDTAHSPFLPLLSAGQEQHPSAVDEVAMENLLREILAPSPIAAPAALPDGSVPVPVTAPPSEHEGPAVPAAEAPSPAARAAETVSAVSVDWEGQADIQRLLGMLPGAQSDAEVFPSALDLDIDFGMGEWDMGGMGTQEVGVC